MSIAAEHGISTHERDQAEKAKGILYSMEEDLFCTGKSNHRYLYNSLENAIANIRGIDRGKVGMDVLAWIEKGYSELNYALSCLPTGNVDHTHIQIIKAAAADQDAIDAKYTTIAERKESQRAALMTGALERLDGGCVTQQDIRVIKAVFAGKDVLDVVNRAAVLAEKGDLAAATQGKQQFSLSDYKGKIEAMKNSGNAKDADAPTANIARKDTHDRG